MFLKHLSLIAGFTTNQTLALESTLRKDVNVVVKVNVGKDDSDKQKVPVPSEPFVGSPTCGGKTDCCHCNPLLSDCPACKTPCINGQCQTPVVEEPVLKVAVMGI